MSAIIPSSNSAKAFAIVSDCLSEVDRQKLHMVCKAFSTAIQNQVDNNLIKNLRKWDHILHYNLRTVEQAFTTNISSLFGQAHSPANKDILFVVRQNPKSDTWKKHQKQQWITQWFLKSTVDLLCSKNNKSFESIKELYLCKAKDGLNVYYLKGTESREDVRFSSKLNQISIFFKGMFKVEEHFPYLAPVWKEVNT
ncbi:MAG: hypothetical protein JHC93_03010 [Parachlamydiales bacterium]|nr:hypothetical protein [Parachlamydiales bacterium]